MPVMGITSPHWSQLKFKWKSLRTAYSMFFISYSLMITLFFLKFMLRLGVDAGIFGKSRHIVTIFVSNFQLQLFSVGMVFFSYCTSVGVVFLGIASQWPEAMKMWHEHEKGLLKSEYKITGWKLSKKLNVTAMVILVLALGKFFPKFFRFQIFRF